MGDCGLRSWVGGFEEARVLLVSMLGSEGGGGDEREIYHFVHFGRRLWRG